LKLQGRFSSSRTGICGGYKLRMRITCLVLAAVLLPGAVLAENLARRSTLQERLVDGGDVIPPPPSGGGIISMPKSIYYHDEPVVFRHRAKGYGRLNVNFVDVHAIFPDWSWFFGQYHGVNKSIGLYENVPMHEVWLGLPNGVSFRDIIVDVNEYSSGQTYMESRAYLRSKEYIRVVRRETRLPDALRLVGEPIRNFGKPVEVDVSIPIERFAGPEETANHGPKRNYELQVVRVGQNMLGGAATTDFGVTNYQILTPSSRIRIADPSYPEIVLDPGTYDIRLMTNGFIVAETRLVLTIDELPGAIRLVNPGGQPINQQIPMALEAPWPLPPGYYYEIEILGVSDTGRLSKPDSYYMLPVEPGATRNLSWGIPRAGTYRARFLIVGAFTSRSGDRPRYILDQLDFNVVEHEDINSDAAVDGPDIFGDYNFSVNGYNVFSETVARITQGDPVNVVLSLTGRVFRAGITYEVALFRASKQQGEAMGPTMGKPHDGPPLEVWQFESDKPATWTIDSNREAGPYHLALTAVAGDERIPMVSPVFWILPSAQGIVSSDAADATPAAIRFDNGRSFNVNTMPNAQFSLAGDKAPGDTRVSFDAIRLGGRVPGCAIERPPHDRQTESDNILFEGFQLSPTGELVLETHGTVGPGPGALAGYVGTYVLRANFGSELLAESAFEIVAITDNGIRITALPQAEFGQYFNVDVALPPDPPHSIDSLDVVLARLGATMEGGGESVSVTETGESEHLGGGVHRFKFLPRELGLYEIRVSRGCTNMRYRHGILCPIVATQQVVVQMSDSPFSLHAGIGSVGLRNDMPPDDDPWPPLGEFLSGAECKPAIIEAEKMDLRYVRWEEGTYVPVSSALNFGDPFFLEGQLAAPAQKTTYSAQVGPADSDTEEVTLFRDEKDNTVVRSELLYFIWKGPKEETNDATQ
jgi:hypothetical protein